MATRETLEAAWSEWMQPAGVNGKVSQGEAWRRANPGQWAQLRAYRDGTGPRPTLIPNDRTAAEHLLLTDAWRELVVVPPPPPPVGILKYRPPAPGILIDETREAMARLDLDNTKDYTIDLGRKRWSSSSSGRSIGLHINGGRHVTIIGGSFEFTRTNASDDATGILIDGGDPDGSVFLEGLDISCANGITVRTKRKVVIQNSRIEVWTYNYEDRDIHPDIVQVWGAAAEHVPCKGIYMHKVTGLTAYSGLVCLVERSPAAQGGAVDPLEWRCDDVNIKPHVRPNGNRDAGAYAYQCSGPTGQADGPYCRQSGYVWAELPTGGGGAYVRPIDGIVVLKYIGASRLFGFPYEIHRPDGTTVYTSPLDVTGGNAPLAESQRAGNYLTYERVPAFAGRRWYIGAPPGGDFCKAGVPGAGYVSPGYV